MTHIPDSDLPSSQPEPTPPRRRPLRWILLGTGAIALSGSLVGGLWVRQFINEKLSPMVSTSLTKLVNRPVMIGPVERFGLGSLRLGPTVVPATETDGDRVEIEAVEVRFNLLEVVFDRRLTLDLALIEPTAYLDQTEDGAWLQTEFTPSEPGPIEIKINRIEVDSATVTLQPFDWTTLSETSSEPAPPPLSAAIAALRPSFVGPIVLGQVNGDATFRNDNQLIAFEVRGLPEAGGQFALQGEVDLEGDRLNLAVQTNELPVAEFGTVVRTPLFFKTGVLNTNLDVALNLANLNDFSFQGSANVQDISAVVPNVPGQLNRTNGVFRFQNRTLTIEDTSAYYGDIRAIAQGTLDFDQGFDLTVSLPTIGVQQVFSTLGMDPPALELAGEFQATATLTGPFDTPRITGAVRNRQPVVADRLTLEAVRTEFVITPDEVTVTTLELLPTVGGQIVGDGSIKLGSSAGLVFNVAAQNVPVDAIAAVYGATLPSSIALGPLNASAQLFGPLNAPEQLRAIANWQLGGTYPAQGEIAFSNNLIQVQNTVVQALDGTVTAEGIASLATRQWQANVAVNQVPMGQFSPQLTGVLDAAVALSGSLDNLSPTGVLASGNASLSDGVSLLAGPLLASFNWQGDRLLLERAEAPGFYADGTITPDFRQTGAAAIAALDINLRLDQFDLATVSSTVALPPTLQLAGLVSFDGQITGSGTDPIALGNAQLANLAANQIAFEPVLAGTVQFDLARGVALDLVGSQDRLAVALNSNFLPSAVLVEVDGAALRAIEEGNTLIGEVENFEVGWLDIAPAAQQGLGVVSGRVNATFQAMLADLSNPVVMANVRVDDPALGYISAQEFSGQLYYGNGLISLNNAELTFPSSRYQVAASYDAGRSPQVQGEITAASGDVGDLLYAMQIFDIEDLTRGLTPPVYGQAEDLAAVPMDVRAYSWLDRLRRLAEIQALGDRQRQADAETFQLPSPSEADGQFTGRIEFTASADRGFTADFNLEGSDWQWGDYNVNRVVAIGEFRDNVLTLLPLRAESEDALLNLSGRIGGEDQSAQLVVENVPMAPLRDLVNLPIQLDGRLNANALLTGSIREPRVTGEVTLSDGVLNATAIEQAGVRLSYNNARFNFIGEMLVGEIKGAAGSVDPDPLRVSGSIPYALPFMAIAPDSDAIQLDVDVQDDGLALMNLFTDQISWLSGEGSVQLRARGTLSNPTLEGSAILSDASFSAQALPDRITGVTGEINFNRDRIQVASLEGRFSEGIIGGQGTLPIAVPVTFLSLTEEEAAQYQPLTLSLRGIDMNFRGLYAGGVEGDIVITGSAFAPLIGGNIQLIGGRVFLASGQQEAAPVTAPVEETEPGLTQPPEFDDLVIQLGENTQILSEPVINFVATGDLVLNGTFTDMRPRGTIQLERGHVNLFTTRFNLTSPTEDFPQTAVFRPSQGLMPSLQVRLLAIVPEVSTPPITNTQTGFASSEVADTPLNASSLGSVESVRIIATVDGPANQIFDNLSLTSDPSRTENQIVGLLGGGTLSALGEGDGTLAIANFAGSALLSTLQNIISRALGLSEFRLFPTTTISEETGESTLELAAEVGLQVTDELSVSILQVLTASEAPQLGLRYRLTDELRLRGSLSPSGDTRAVLEYQIQF